MNVTRTGTWLRCLATAATMVVLWGSAAPAAPKALNQARGLWLSGKYAEALEAYRECAKDEPAAAALGVARCQASVGKLDEAVQTLSEAAKDNPDAALHAELARLAFGRGDYPAARQSVAAAIERDDHQLLARWIRAELFRASGQLDEALAAYEWFVDYYNDADKIADAESLRWIGLGAAQFARWRRLSDQFSFLVNELFPDALELEEAYWQAHYESGLLYLEKYNQAEASRDLKAALALNPNSAEVHAALAGLALQDYNLDEARRLLQRALEINPRLVEAHVFQADALLANFEAQQAIEILEKARRLNPVSEQVLGRLAAAYMVVDGIVDDPSGTRAGKLIDEATARNPRAGEFFYALAGGLDQTRKFPAAAHYYREAVEKMPQLVAPRGALGLMYMRLGDEVQAKKLLDEAFDVDPFNVRVSNTLKVLEVLEEYAVLETEHFVIKFDRIQDEILAKYVAAYLEEEVYPALSNKFGFKPREKSLFEIFNRSRNTNGHGWFSARMVGLPYIGTVGACAGKMVALASPNDMPNKYNWARVVKHEFVHVLNLQQSNFNIPHWYTEALAVQSEGYPRPQVWNELLAQRVPKGELFNLDDINLGFVRPKSSLDWQMAYCQAQLYAQYMLQKYGDDALAKMLDAYAANMTTRAALKSCFNVEQEAFEKGYREHLEKIAQELGPANKQAGMSFAQLQRAFDQDPDNIDLMAQLAYEHVQRKNYPEARTLAERVIEKQARHQLATYVLARVRLVIGENDRAVELLEECLDRQQPQQNVVNLLAALKYKAELFDDAAELYRLGGRHDPYNSQWIKSLARVYLAAGDNEKLASVLAELARLDADDLTIRKKLAEMALARQDYPQAVDWANQALQIDVMDVQIHRVLAEASLGTDDNDRAIEEYEVAVKLSPKDPSLQFALAGACIQAKKLDRARKALDTLEKLDPDYPGADLLRESLKP